MILRKKQEEETRCCENGHKKYRVLYRYSDDIVLLGEGRKSLNLFLTQIKGPLESNNMLYSPSYNWYYIQESFLYIIGLFDRPVSSDLCLPGLISRC